MWRYTSLLLALGLVLIFAIGLRPGQSSGSVGHTPRLVPSSNASVGATDAPPLVAAIPDKDPKLSWPLVQLVDADAAFWVQGAQVSAATVGLLPKPLRDLDRARLMHIDPGGRVQVFIRTDASATSLAFALRLSGVRIERVSEKHGIVQGRVLTRQLRTVATTADVKSVTLPDYGVVQAGAVNTEGDDLLNAAAARSSYGIDGSGVRVGVISDGVEGLAISQGSGDLPNVNTETCNMVAQSPTSLGAGAEGTAMLEIVHDLAPGAELWFGHFGGNFNGTVLDFMAAVDCLADNVDVVVDDVGWYNVGPYDGTSLVSENATDALNDPGNRIRAYYNAGGNHAGEHYQEDYIQSAGWFLGALEGVSPFWYQHDFRATANTTDAGSSLPCHCADAALVRPGGTITVHLQWDDPWGRSSNDYDLLASLDGGVAYFLASVNPQAGNEFPREFFTYTNNGFSDQWVNIAIGNFDGLADARNLDMFVLCDGCDGLPTDGQPIHNFNTACSSVPNNSDAGGGVVSLGAINAGDPGTNDVASYSSCGPTNDGRMKPDAAAIDGVSVTGNGGFSSTFFGTSAAAPHAAGVAALLLDCDPTLAREQLHDALLGTAVDLGSSGPDNVSGHGRIDALEAAASVGCASGGRTATPTTVAPPTSTLAPTSTPGPPPSECGAGPCMALTLKDGGDCTDTVCQVEAGAQFRLAVEIVEAPAEGYISVQSWVAFGSDLVYKPLDAPVEFVMEECATTGTSHPAGGTAVAHGCVTGIIPPLPVSHYVGTFVSLDFNCSEKESSTLVRILPEGEDPAATSGAHFVLPNNDHVIPELAGLTVVCAGSATSTPPPTSTPVPQATPPPATATSTHTPTDIPTATSTPTQLVGDTNCDGTVNALDATLILQFAAGLLGLMPCHDEGDTNGDLRVNALDATLVLQHAAGLLGSLGGHR